MSSLPIGVDLHPIEEERLPNGTFRRLFEKDAARIDSPLAPVDRAAGKSNAT
jgi:hypothetical protein